MNSDSIRKLWKILLKLAEAEDKEIYDKLSKEEQRATDMLTWFNGGQRNFFVTKKK